MWTDDVLKWVSQYGYVAIVLLLVFGIVGLPIPDETMLTFTGYLIYKGKLSFPLALISAIAGSICGITISYTLGRTFGLPLIHKYGKYLHITEADLNRMHRWFERVGHWGLTIGYYIPGVRHFTAYAAGISDLAPKTFAIFAYSGAIIWSLTFICLGYFLGDRWDRVSKDVQHLLVLGLVSGFVLSASFVLWRRYKHRRRK